MADDRIKEVARILVDYSTKTKIRDRVLIRTETPAKDLALEVYKYALQRGAYPWIKAEIPGWKYILHQYASEAQIGFLHEHELVEIKNTDVYIYLLAPLNVRELSGVNPTKISARVKALKPITDWRVEKTRWVAFYYPTEGLAQEAEMSLPEFEDFVFKACLIDWKGVSQRLQTLKKVVDAVDKVEIVSPDTHLEFSIKGRNSVAADGNKNMPDGELFTSVMEESVKGSIRFDVPATFSMYGNVVEDITLTFEEGEVKDVKAVKNQAFLEKMMTTDAGAKRIGEFGIGYNYGITKSVKNILFDEKIGGTIHLALGRGYKETLSKNESAVHMDLIKDMRKDGEIYFDGKLVMTNGKWLNI